MIVQKKTSFSESNQHKHLQAILSLTCNVSILTEKTSVFETE